MPSRTPHPNWARRPENDTPRMQQRTFRDARGRTWTGSISSGSIEGGERFAEVIFVCRDQPGELKRVARLDAPPAAAPDRWQKMKENELLQVFHRSEPA